MFNQYYYLNSYIGIFYAGYSPKTLPNLVFLRLAPN